MGRGGGRAAAPTSRGAAGHSMGMGQVCARTDVNGRLWMALASPSFSQAVWHPVSISLGARGGQGRVSPAARWLPLPVLLAWRRARPGRACSAPTSTLTCWDGPRLCPAPGIPGGRGHLHLMGSARTRDALLCSWVLTNARGSGVGQGCLCPPRRGTASGGGHRQPCSSRCFVAVFAGPIVGVGWEPRAGPGGHLTTVPPSQNEFKYSVVEPGTGTPQAAMPQKVPSAQPVLAQARGGISGVPPRRRLRSTTGFKHSWSRSHAGSPCPSQLSLVPGAWRQRGREGVSAERGAGCWAASPGAVRAGSAAAAAFGRKARASRSSRCLNGCIAPRGFYSFASLSPQMYSLLPLPSPLFVQLLSWTIFHAPLTAAAFPARVSLAAS